PEGIPPRQLPSTPEAAQPAEQEQRKEHDRQRVDRPPQINCEAGDNRNLHQHETQTQRAKIEQQQRRRLSQIRLSAAQPQRQEDKEQRRRQGDGNHGKEDDNGLPARALHAASTKERVKKVAGPHQVEEIRPVIRSGRNVQWIIGDEISLVWLQNKGSYFFSARQTRSISDFVAQLRRGLLQRLNLGRTERLLAKQRRRESFAGRVRAAVDNDGYVLRGVTNAGRFPASHACGHQAQCLSRLPRQIPARYGKDAAFAEMLVVGAE